MIPAAPYCHFFFFNDTATTEIYTLSLHDALPICDLRISEKLAAAKQEATTALQANVPPDLLIKASIAEIGKHTSELQSRQYLVCRLLLEKKKNKKYNTAYYNRIPLPFINPDTDI